MHIFRLMWFLIVINFKDFGYWFWTLLYPLLLGGLFMLTTSNITSASFEEIDVGIEAGQPLEMVLEEIDYLNLSVMPEDTAVEEMKAGEIDGYIHGDSELLVTDTGISQTILESILTEIQQVEASGIPYGNFDYDTQFVDMNSQNNQPESVLFYALLSMIAFYGMFSSIEFISTMQPNLSVMGARFSASPFSKMTLLVASTIGALALNLFSNIIILITLLVFYQVELFSEFWPTLLLIFIANLTGIGLGLLIGLIPRINAGIKTTIAVIGIIALSFLAGLMGPFIKVIINENMPVLNTLNPAALLTDTMYRINFLDNYSSYWTTIGILAAYAAVFFFITLLVLRRKQYDSI